MCVIYDIFDEEFLQNLIHMIYRPSYIWIIMLNIEINLINPLIRRFVKLYGPPSLHPNEQVDEMTIANYISSNILYWNFMLSINVVQHHER